MEVNLLSCVNVDVVGDGGVSGRRAFPTANVFGGISYDGIG
jgi:hypothetical protein